MAALNRKFNLMHGVSALLNLGTLAAAVGYSFTLAARLV